MNERDRLLQTLDIAARYVRLQKAPWSPMVQKDDLKMVEAALSPPLASAQEAAPFGLVCSTDDKGGFSGELTTHGKALMMSQGKKLYVYAAPHAPAPDPVQETLLERLEALAASYDRMAGHKWASAGVRTDLRIAASDIRAAIASVITSESATQVKGVEDAATELSKHSRTDFIRGAQWAAKSEHEVIAAFLERTGQYVTNDASREAAIQKAGADAELQYREALHCLSDVMRAATHALVGMAPSQTEAKLRAVLHQAHVWFMAEVNSDTYMGEPANQPKENEDGQQEV